MASVSCLMRVVVMACGASIVLATELVSAQAVFDERNTSADQLRKALTPVAPTITRGEPITVRGFDPLTPDAAAPVQQGTTGHTGGASLLISFMSNSTNLTPAAKAALDQLGKALRSEQLAAYRFQVEGHADPRGPSDVNMRLSTERAQAVVQYLSSVGGVAPERLTAVGRGSTQPMNRHNPAAPENRRVTIITVQ